MASRGTSVYSTFNKFSHCKYGRGSFITFILNHAGDNNYRAICKKSMNLLQDIKWNGHSDPLDTHVYNHCQALEDLQYCDTHINTSVPYQAQQVKYLIDSISCSDKKLKVEIEMVHANINNMHHNFEAATSTLIVVNPLQEVSETPIWT